MEKWEHRIHQDVVGNDEGLERLQSVLAAIGEEGWELVSVTAVNVRWSAGVEAPQFTCFLKRRKQ